MLTLKLRTPRATLKTKSQGFKQSVTQSRQQKPARGAKKQTTATRKTTTRKTTTRKNPREITQAKKTVSSGRVTKPKRQTKQKAAAKPKRKVQPREEKKPSQRVLLAAEIRLRRRAASLVPQPGAPARALFPSPTPMSPVKGSQPAKTIQIEARAIPAKEGASGVTDSPLKGARQPRTPSKDFLQKKEALAKEKQAKEEAKKEKALRKLEEKAAKSLKGKKGKQAKAEQSEEGAPNQQPAVTEANTVQQNGNISKETPKESPQNPAQTTTQTTAIVAEKAQPLLAKTPAKTQVPENPKTDKVEAFLSQQNRTLDLHSSDDEDSSNRTGNLQTRRKRGRARINCIPDDLTHPCAS